MVASTLPDIGMNDCLQLVGPWWQGGLSPLGQWNRRSMWGSDGCSAEPFNPGPKPRLRDTSSV